MIEVYGYKKCSTVNKAVKFLENYDEIKFFDFVANQIDKQTLKNLIKLSGLPINRFFNTSGMLYREQGLKDKLPNLNDEEKVDLLLTNGMLIKRPLIKIGSQVFVGFPKKVQEEIETILK